MEEITVVRRRSRVWPLLITLLLVALIVVAALWLMGSQPVDFGWNELNELTELERRSSIGIT
jgi:hypothetical protein